MTVSSMKEGGTSILKGAGELPNVAPKLFAESTETARVEIPITMARLFRDEKMVAMTFDLVA